MASSSSSAAEAPEDDAWNEDYIVELKKGRHSSYAWNYFGNLKNKTTKRIFYEKFYFCKICVEEKNLLTPK